MLTPPDRSSPVLMFFAAPVPVGPNPTAVVKIKNAVTRTVITSTSMPLFFFMVFPFFTFLFHDAWPSVIPLLPQPPLT